MKKLDILENQVNTVYLGIGSNLGNRVINIEKAKSLLLENHVNLISISSYFETFSWPDPNKPKFINIIVKAQCVFKPIQLLKLCKSIEVKLGRKKTPKNFPRECDIDIIDYLNKEISGKIILPHPRMHLRNFVLLPLFEINKNWMHPISKQHIKYLIFSLPNRDIRSIKQI
mgnify:CR=1 FL=1